jgi:hypothetical protein
MVPLILALLAAQPTPLVGYTGEFRIQPTHPERLQSDAETAERAMFEVCLPGLTGELDVRDRFARPFPEMQAMFDESARQLGETDITFPTNVPAGGVSIRLPDQMGRCLLASHTGDHAATLARLRAAFQTRGWAVSAPGDPTASTWTAADPTGRFEAAATFESGFNPRVSAQLVDRLSAHARIEALRAINAERPALAAAVAAINDLCPMLILGTTDTPDDQIRMEAAFATVESSVLNIRPASLLVASEAGVLTLTTADARCIVEHRTDAPADFANELRIQLLLTGWLPLDNSARLSRTIADRPIWVMVEASAQTSRIEIYVDPDWYPPPQHQPID